MSRVAWLLTVAAAAIFALAVTQIGCGGTAVQQQARAADAVARAFNNVARPAIVGAYELSCRAAIESACPSPPCDRAPMVAALAACEARWQPAFAAYEAARAAHGGYRATLMRCQGTPDGGSCGLDLQRDATNVLRAVAAYRCAVRSLGRADLDPIPGAVDCTEVRDGG